MTDRPSPVRLIDFLAKYLEYLDGKCKYEDLPVLGSDQPQDTESLMAAAMEYKKQPQAIPAASDLPLPKLSEENQKKAEEAYAKYEEFAKPKTGIEKYITVHIEPTLYNDGLDDFMKASDDLIPFEERQKILGLVRIVHGFDGHNYRSEYLPYLLAVCQAAPKLIKMIIKLEEYYDHLRDELRRVRYERFGY
jgi:hypothetical protein